MEIRPALAPYVPLARMLAQTFVQACEVVLHDLAAGFVQVVEGMEKFLLGLLLAGDELHVIHQQQVGLAVFFPHFGGFALPDGVHQLVRQVILSNELKEDFVANYYFIAPNGKRIRSSTLLIRDGDGRLTGALCLNLDTTCLTQQIAYLQSLLPQPREPEPEPPEPQTGAEHVAVMIENLMDRIIGDEPPLTREARLEKIRFMDSKGIFLMKGSIEKAAEKLGVNKVTIYSYLDEVRGKRG